MDSQELKAALAPFLRYADVNDKDTLSRLLPDSKVVAVAAGSWDSPAPITLGDVRRVAAIARNLG